MLADYFSKPVQGSLFKTFRNVIMGWSHISDLFESYIRPEERVEKQDKISDKLAMEEETARTARSKHVANRKQQTYADAVKSHTEVVMNEMLDHLIQ